MKKRAAPARRTADRTSTRARLLRAATRLFAAKGFDGVAVDEIVAAAGVNKRLVYHYFGSKEDLYVAVLGAVFSQLEEVEVAALASTAGPTERLRGLLHAYFDFLDDHPEFVRLLLWENLHQGDHLARDPACLRKAPFLARFEQVIDDGLSSGVFRPPSDRRHLAVNFIGLCFIYFSNRYSLAASMGLRTERASERRRRLDQVTDLVFHGVLARPHQATARPEESGRGRRERRPAPHRQSKGSSTPN